MDDNMYLDKESTMPTIILFLKSTIHIIVIVLLIIIAITITTCSYYRNGLNDLKVVKENAISSLEIQYEKQFRQLEKEEYERRIESDNIWREREKVIMADATDARSIVDSMSNTINTITLKATSDAEFAQASSRLLGDQLKECSGEYYQMAKSTDEANGRLQYYQNRYGE